MPSCPGILASSLGRVMTEPYEVEMPKGGTRTRQVSPTFGSWDGARFIVVIRRKTYKVARLVCEAFNGPGLEGQVCMHDDEDARNNRPWNLVWGTQKQNLNYPGFLRYCKSRVGADSPRAKWARRAAVYPSKESTST